MADAIPTPVSAKRGIIGFFDILGYESFLQNNQVSDAVNAVLDALLRMPKEARDYCQSIIGGKDLETHRFFGQFQDLIFSDSILLTCPFDSDESDDSKRTKWLAFTLQCVVLQRQMFDFGLPIRGVITHGEYIVQSSCFAGRPIIEAYRKTNSLNLAAVVFTKSAKDAVDALSPRGEVTSVFLGRGLVVEYLVPLKLETTERHYTLNFANLPSPPFKSLSDEERKVVSRCFWSHNKDIPPSTYDKLTNTEMFLRFLKAQHPRI